MKSVDTIKKRQYKGGRPVAKHQTRQWQVIKYGLFLVWACLLFGLSSWAADLTGELTRMEEQLFARTYTGEPADSRLDRLETVVFGAPQENQPAQTRLQALSHFFQPAPASAPSTMVQQQMSPNHQQTRPDIVEYRPTDPAVPSSPPMSADGTAYPAVSAMEQRVFGQTFESEVLANRLGRLESRVLGQVQTGTLQERTDQLRLVVLGDAGTGDDYGANQSRAYADPSGSGAPYPGTSGEPRYVDNASHADMLRALPLVEKKVLRNTFPQDSIENRLSRLEMRLFNATASEMPPEDRLYRIVGVVNAKGPDRNYNAYGSGGPSGGSYPPPSAGASIGPLGSMLLMILMSLL